MVVSLEDHVHDGGEKFLYFHGLDTAINIKDVYGIPLTDEWMKDLGLVERYVQGEWSWANCTPGKVWNYNTEIHTKRDQYIYNDAYPPIEYVHQLQNLYNAMTREELNYTRETIKVTGDKARIIYLEEGIRDSIKKINLCKDYFAIQIGVDPVSNIMIRKLSGILESLNGLLN
jgi:hypothetical protein